MKSLLVFAFLFSITAQAKILVHYTYLKAKKPVQKSISFEELKRAYNIVKSSTYKAPGPEDFFKEYLRFKMGVEVALNEKKLVKNPNLDNQINNPFLRQEFHQDLYKYLAEMKLKKQMEKLDKTSANLSDKALKNLYSKEPEFNILFISVQHPIGPSQKQIKEAEVRAKKIYAQVKKSKKPFLELVALYSDDKANGVLAINRSRASIFPEVYKKLKAMRNNSISSPIQVDTGYMIVRLNYRVPFSSANKVAIKANYYNKRRSTIFNGYFDSLKKHFKVKLVNRDLVKTL